MRKYYVRSGQIEQVVTANDPKEAVNIVIQHKVSGEIMDPVGFYVDERGFRGPTPDNPVFETDMLPKFFFEVKDIFPNWNLLDDI